MILRPKTTHPYKSAKLANFEIRTWEEPAYGYWTDTLHQIICKSKQERLQKTVPKDSTVRFKNLNTYKSWASTGVLFFALANHSGDVGGLIWFEKKQNPIIPEAETTFAIRMYDGYEGRGLAKPFMSVAHFMLPKLMDVNQHIWLETDADNTPARGLYTSFGYEQIGITDAGRVLMAYDRQDESQHHE